MPNSPIQQLRLYAEGLVRKVRRKPLYAVEAFAGAGLFSLGMIAEGIEVGQVCEIDEAAVETLRFNIHTDATVCDATEWSPKRPRGGVDVLFGGPPCQPFSRLGKRRGAEDPRFLLDEFVRWARELRPRVILMENVRGLLEEQNRWIVERWLREIGDAGYEAVVWTILAADYGTPQLRPRVVFCAWPRGAKWGKVLRQPPPRTHVAPDVAGSPLFGIELPPWTSALERLTSGCCGRWQLYSCARLNNVGSTCNGCVNGDRFAEAANEVAAETPFERLKRKGRLPTAPSFFVPEAEKQFPEDHPLFPGWLYKPGTEPTGEISLGDVSMLIRDPSRIRSRHPFVDIASWPEEFRRSRKTRWLAPTLTASLAKGAPMGLLLEPGATFHQGATVQEYQSLRRMTVREAAKLMDVPQWYIFRGPIREQYRQIGNGVPVNMARAIARHVLNAFGRKVPEPRSLATDADAGLWQTFPNRDGCTSYKPDESVQRWRRAYAGGRR